MSDNSAGFIGDIPRHYDIGLGPNIFVDFADRLTSVCCDGNPTNVIELAAGTGIVSRKLRDGLHPETSLLVTDLNAPMLEVARGKFAEEENVDFAVADAMELTSGDAEFDLMVCQFGVMFFPDKPAAFREAKRALCVQCFQCDAGKSILADCLRDSRTVLSRKSSGILQGSVSLREPGYGSGGPESSRMAGRKARDDPAAEEDRRSRRFRQRARLWQSANR